MLVFTFAIIYLIKFYSHSVKNAGYTFDIEYGKHFADLRHHIWIPRFHNTSKPLKFNVIFNSSCLYDLHGDDKYDVNKLYGYSEGDHRQNSIRVGWRGINGYIEVFAYYTIDGVDSNDEISLGKFEPEELIQFRITKTNSLYHIKVNNYITAVKRGSNIKHGWFSYILKPYFGGNETAGHNMSIKIFEL